MDQGFFQDVPGPFVVFIIGFLVVFTVVVLGFGAAIVTGIWQWSRNNKAPRLTVPAVLVGKRQEHSRSNDSSTTWYYVTFELPGHARVELPVHGRQWGTMVEGDHGQLTYQGTRFKGFDRVPQDR